MRYKSLLVIFIFLGLFFFINQAEAEDTLDQTTEKLLNNISGNNRPNDIKIEESEWSTFFNLNIGKADFNQKAKLPSQQISAEKPNDFQKIIDAILFKSSDKEKGYYNSFLPFQQTVDTKTILNTNSQKLNCALLSRVACDAEKAAETSVANSGTGTTVTSGTSSTSETGTENLTDMIEASEKILSIAGESCGWRQSKKTTVSLVTTVKERFDIIKKSTGAPPDIEMISCMKNEMSALNKATYELLYWSAAFNDYLQCVGYVRAVAALQGKGLVGGRNAKDYCSNVPSDYQKFPGSVVQAGDIAVQTDGSVGHIFIVQEVSQSGKWVKKLEANWGSGTIRQGLYEQINNIGCIIRKK